MFDQSSSVSTTNTTNVTDTFTANFAESFNNALNTTQSFNNIGNVQLPDLASIMGDSGVKFSANSGVTIALVLAAVFGLVFFLKRKK